MAELISGGWFHGFALAWALVTFYAVEFVLALILIVVGWAWLLIHSSGDLQQCSQC